MKAPLPAVVAGAPEADFAEIAAALGVSKQAVQKRSIKESWPYREQPQRGGKKRLFPFTTLPKAVREAVQAARLNALHPGAVPSAPALTSPSSSPATTTAGVLPATERLERPAGVFIPAVAQPLPSVPMCIEPAAPPAVIMVRGTKHKARDDAHLNDKQRAQRDGALVLCRALDAAIAATGCAVKEACQNVAARILGGIAHPELIEAASVTYVKPRASGQTVSSLTSRLQKMFPLYRAGCLAGDPGLYLTPGAPEPTGYDPIHIAAFLRHYCKPVRPSVMEAWRHSEAWFAAQSLPRPAVATFYRIETSLPVTVKYRGRVTGSEWRALKPYVDRDVSMFKSNDIWVGDGHSFKAKVQHPIHGQPFVPEVTIIIDWVSRRIVGWSVDLAESTVAVSAAFRNAQLNTRARPLVYYSDNGSGQTGKPIDCPIHGTLARQGIAHETGIPGNPQGRGIIERLWQVTTIPLARTYPTCTWKGADKEHTRKMLQALNRKDGTAERLLPSFNQFLGDLAAMVHRYNTGHEHRELGGNTPEAEYLARLDPQSIVFGPSDQEIAVQWLPEVGRTPQRGLVSLFGNEYARKSLVDELEEGEKVRVRYDIHDASRVFLLRMDGRAIGEAVWDAHKRAAFPVPRMDQLREQRAAGKVKRGEGIIAEAQAELGRVIDMSAFTPMAVVPDRREQEQADVAAVKQALEASGVTVMPGIDVRPFFRTDPDKYRWLARNPQLWDRADAEWLLDYVTGDEYLDLLVRFEYDGLGWTEQDAARAKRVIECFEVDVRVMPVTQTPDLQQSQKQQECI
jgi:putative transposase